MLNGSGIQNKNGHESQMSVKECVQCVRGVAGGLFV